MKINYIHGDIGMIDQVKFLWCELNEHHQAVSPYFKEEFGSFSFSHRVEKLENKYSGCKLRIDIARDQDQAVGYVISGINAEQVGEIESIYVQSSHRGLGIGDTLMKLALIWLESNHARSMVIDVASGNENVLAFYTRYGFYPRVIRLRHKESETGEAA